MVEGWPHPNVPVYVVCPRDGEACSWTLHRNYLLPIGPNIEQAMDDTPVASIEQVRVSTPVTSVDSEPANSEPSGMAISDTTGNTSQGSHNQPAPPRCSRHATQIPSMLSLWWIFGCGSGPKVIRSKHSCPHKKTKRLIPIETLGVFGSPIPRMR